MAFPTVVMTHKEHGEAVVPADEASEWRKRGWTEKPVEKPDKTAGK